MATPTIPARLLSRAVGTYLNVVPVERGKTRLRRSSSRFLVARLDTGPWIRVSGVVDFEWDVLAGKGKEERTRRLFEAVLRPGQTVLDLGANIGYFTLTAAKAVGSAGAVHAFEPTPAVHDRLVANLALNGFDRVTPHRLALSDAAGTLHFHVGGGGDAEGNSLFAPETPGAAQVIEVTATTLDDFARARGLTRVDVIKVDVEGAEVRALRGGTRLLAAPEAPMLFLEVNDRALQAAGDSDGALFRQVEALGYRWAIVEEMPWEGQITRNVFAWKPAHAGRFPTALVPGA